MDSRLHPEDLIRVDKRWVLFSLRARIGSYRDSDFFTSTFEAVVEHIHGILFARARRRCYAEKAIALL